MTPFRRNIAIAGLLAALLAGAWLAYAYGHQFSTPERMAAHLRAAGIWAPVVVIGLMVLHSFVPFPAEILALCAGAVFGTLMGSVLIWCGAMLGALVAFALARWLGRDVVRGWLSASQARQLDAWTEAQGAFTLLILRFLPVVAFNLINYAAGLTRVRLWTFVWTTALGILPVTVLCAWLGARMRGLDWPAMLALSAGGILALVLLHRLARSRGWV
ncbi:TVP38/TMEM64 family protein [Ruegeria sediminis]|uniref:TVP38/TMEM64 family membrane protein n=1 Tax=Ruegeria sediminis TaxID=2583820 RepID=A0ABY2WU63_9RHOB|nr:TVP38/TMEM64 family protein [Ruegeria sediminis]TMV04772.1 TVP38/TMEM64 family protein [Ruegeria sediminis]